MSGTGIPETEIKIPVMENEKDILSKIATNDETAFKQVFEYYYPKVKTFLEQFISDADEAMDLAQNIFIKIWLQRSNLTEIRSFGAFLYTMTRNAAIDYGRTHKIKIPLTEVELKGKDDYETESEFYAKEVEAQVAHMIRKMPQKRRRVFIMSRLEGRSYTEIAYIMNISKKTVENHINLALKELRKITKAISIFFSFTI
jgi:RNA polymerase sigma-70 factor (ECF subfamily)